MTLAARLSRDPHFVAAMLAAMAVWVALRVFYNAGWFLLAGI
jgi:hypothetical protein